MDDIEIYQFKVGVSTHPVDDEVYYYFKRQEKWYSYPLPIPFRSLYRYGKHKAKLIPKEALQKIDWLTLLVVTGTTKEQVENMIQEADKEYQRIQVQNIVVVEWE